MDPRILGLYWTPEDGPAQRGLFGRWLAHDRYEVLETSRDVLGRESYMVWAAVPSGRR